MSFTETKASPVLRASQLEFIYTNTLQNLSFVLEGIKKVKFEERPVPEIIDPYDVLINVKYTGICGSDVSLSCPV